MRKKIVDFSKMNWTEIEKLQRENNISLCGMYNPKQLDNWGQEIPSYNNPLLKVAAITGLTASFAASSFGQTTNISDSIVIKGKIIDETTSEELPNVYVSLKNNKVRTISDIKGNFKLVIQSVSTTLLTDTLEAHFVGYKKNSLF
jgi:hypothetical protein